MWGGKVGDLSGDEEAEYGDESPAKERSEKQIKRIIKSYGVW